jgi:glyoxylase-like metal-dependent hydrolase (beta-lactamase superfamily II)
MLITTSPTVITDNLLVLGPIQYPIYFVRSGGEAAIFEGGVGACGPVVEGHVAQLGLSRDSVKQIVVTHGHPDHVMAVPTFRRLFPQARVLASPQAAAVMVNEKAVGFFSKMDGALTQWLLSQGAITEQQRPTPLAEFKIPVDATIKEGDTVTVGDLRFGVLATPGHSECQLAFYEPKAGLLIASDATGFFMPEYDQTWWPNYFTDYGQYMNSIRKLAALDARVLCLSHNAVVTGAEAVKSYFARVIAATEAYHQRIVAAVKSGTPVKTLAEQLGAEAHARGGRLALDFFQKSCASLIKLSLKHEGIEAA